MYLSFKNIVKTVLASLLLFIPISEIVIQVINYFLSKIIKPKIIPKLDFNEGIPKDYSTFVVIPTILNSKEKVKELIKKLEVYYLANKSENIYFALLGDCIGSKNRTEKIDEEIIKVGLEEIEKLNNKYNKNQEQFPKFHFLYRQRTWNSSQECYLGCERKRGLLYQFNEFLLDGTNKFLTNTIYDYYLNNYNPKTYNLKTDKNNNDKWISFENDLQIKYVITLDQDTNLILQSGLELIGTMAHILNKPVLNEKNDLVVDGHAIIQPRVGINLEASKKTLFTKLYAGIGGTDSYTNAVSDIYQDNFDE